MGGKPDGIPGDQRQTHSAARCADTKEESLKKYLVIKTVKYTSDEDKQEIVFSTDWEHEAISVCMAFNRHARWNTTYQLFVLYEEKPQ